MPLSFDQILAELAALQPEAFDLKRLDSYGIERLNALTHDLMLLPQPERAISALFAVMERMPVAEMGTPGPLVHTLEKMRGHYEHELVKSIERQPAYLSIWMVNRILNATRDSRQRQIYLDLLRIATEHPKTPESVRLEAEHFIQFQSRAA